MAMNMLLPWNSYSAIDMAAYTSSFISNVVTSVYCHAS